MDLLAQEENLDRLVPADQLVNEEAQVPVVLPVVQDHVEELDQVEELENVENVDQPVLLEPEERLVLLDPADSLDRLVLVDLADHVETEGKLDHLDHLDLLVGIPVFCHGSISLLYLDYIASFRFLLLVFLFYLYVCVKLHFMIYYKKETCIRLEVSQIYIS